VKRSTLIIGGLAAVALLAAVTLGVLLLVPQMSRLTLLTTQAEEAKASLARLEATAVGEEFEKELRIFAGKRTERAADVEIARARLASKLDAPFPEMKMAAGASRPAADEFQRAYDFHGDQLRVRIRDLVARSGGPEVKEIQLLRPPFSSGPLDDAAMKKWQRFANVETRILEVAARSAAAPSGQMRLDEEPAPPDDLDSAYQRFRIGLDLVCPEGKVSGLVHGLLAAFDDSGGILRLVGLSEAPMPEGRLREIAGSPIKRVAVTLSLGFPTPIEDAR
jgi:hypothetical protein